MKDVFQNIATSEINGPCCYSARYLFQEFMIEVLAPVSDFIICFQLVYQSEKHGTKVPRDISLVYSN